MKKSLISVLIGFSFVLLLSTLTACAWSVTGGLVSFLAAVLLVGSLLLGGATQSGCDFMSPCLSMAPCLSLDASPNPEEVGACLSVLPCLSLDAKSWNDQYVGPCLSVVACLTMNDLGPGDRPLPDAGDELPLGPCLDQPAPDAGDELPLGPCLDQPAPDAGIGSLMETPSEVQPEPIHPRERERLEVREKLAAQLPADVLQRLRQKS